MNSSKSTTTGPAEPTIAFRFGRVSAAVFSETTKTGTAMHVSLRRSYRDADGAWQHTNVLQPADLLPAALALTRCYEHIAAASKEAP